MELRINSEKENALFKRKEISGTITSNTAPSRMEVVKALAEKLKVPEETIKIKGINGKFGSKEFGLEVNIYSSEEDKKMIELKKKKDGAPEATASVTATPAAEEKPAEAAETKSAEEPKEAPKEEAESKEESKEKKKGVAG